MSGDTIVINISKPCKLIMNVESEAPSECDCSECPQGTRTSEANGKKYFASIFKSV